MDEKHSRQTQQTRNAFNQNFTNNFQVLYLQSLHKPHISTRIKICFVFVSYNILYTEVKKYILIQFNEKDGTKMYNSMMKMILQKKKYFFFIYFQCKK